MIRIRQNINRNWKFHRADAPGAQEITFNDSTWQSIGLPHCFDLPYFRTPEFYVGPGWYRKRFSLSPSPGLPRAQSSGTPGEGRGEGFRAFLEFEAAFQLAEVYLNGKLIGQHAGGYTPFTFDITPFVKPTDNLLAIRVDNSWNPQLSPRAGEHIFSGGLYRDVHLLITNPLHIAWHGTFVTTPRVSRESATVNIKTLVQNDSPESKQCTIRHTIHGPDGNTILELRATQSIAPGQSFSFDQTSDPIPHPKLWHPDHPNLYTARTEIYDKENLVDETDTPFGIRFFEWTADRGFFLNGQHLYLRGANAHQDHAGWGIGITQAACYRDVRLLKEAGFNFVRGAHYPHHTAFARACDEIGLLFWSENCFWGKGGFGPEGYWNASAYPVNPEDFQPFEDHCKQTLTEMIHANRNHPSIIAWSMTNEAFFTYNLDRAKILMSDLVKLSKQLDPTRPAAIGGSQRGDVDHLGDIAGYNGDGARLFLNPGVPNMVSEYGAISKPPDAYDPFFGDLQPEQFPWRSGQAIWAAFDYGSIAGKQGLKGILDHARLPKQSWHWYRDNYFLSPPSPGLPRAQSSGTPGESRGENSLKIPNSSSNIQSSSPSPGTPGEGRGEGLSLNVGNSMLNSQRSPQSPTSNIQHPTSNVESKTEILTGNPAARLRLTTDKNTITGTDATDDCQLIVTVCDRDGNHTTQSPPVTLTIESGPGEFPTGSSITFDAKTDIGINNGHAAIAFRSYDAGATLIRATSPNLQDAIVTIFTTGYPSHDPSKPSLAISRPYIRPAPSTASLAALNNIVNIARDRPSRASSESPNHPARLANDANPTTTWIAHTNQTAPSPLAVSQTIDAPPPLAASRIDPSSPPTSPNPWWQVDLEGFYQISGLRLHFPSPLNWRFLVEFSLDAKSWTLAVDRSDTMRIDAIRNEITPPGSLARYVRINFPSLPANTPASLCEAEVYGVLSVR
jgi:Glycosyl hydrolases family 2, TIM barrel domain/Glycosyl hydrolases family 2/Glycosyl hydrolases family 2, sugar binding domain/F5/8 type C domain